MFKGSEKDVFYPTLGLLSGDSNLSSAGKELTNAFVGIAPSDVLGFVVVEVMAALLVVGILALLKPKGSKCYTRGLR